MVAFMCKADLEAIVELQDQLKESAASQLKLLPILMEQIARGILDGSYERRFDAQEDLTAVMQATLFTSKPFASEAYNRLFSQFETQLTDLAHSGGPVLFQEDRPDLKLYEPVFSAEALEAQKLGDTAAPKRGGTTPTP